MNSNSALRRTTCVTTVHLTYLCLSYSPNGNKCLAYEAIWEIRGNLGVNVREALKKRVCVWS